MGPRLFRRGNHGAPGTIAVQAKLQWGHVFSDVEIFKTAWITGDLTELQWGHVFSDVEITEWADDVISLIMLQWGHVFSDVEMSSRRR